MFVCGFYGCNCVIYCILKKIVKRKKTHQKPRADLEEKKIQYVFIIMIENAGNNIVFTCKAHYINCILKKLGFNSASGNPT